MLVEIKSNCGHTVERDLKNSVGNDPSPKSLKKNIEYWSTKDCTACWKAGKTVDLEAVNDSYNLPPLVGSDKQVAWAEKIRLEVIGKLEAVVADPVGKFLENIDPECPDEHRNEFIDSIAPTVLAKFNLLIRVVEAKFWIEVRGEKWSLVLGHANEKTGKVTLNWTAKPKFMPTTGGGYYVGGTKNHKNEVQLSNYYEILGVSKTDSGETIHKAFRKKAMVYHPDRNKKPSAEDMFKEINHANQVLGDPFKRMEYDNP